MYLVNFCSFKFIFLWEKACIWRKVDLTFHHSSVFHMYLGSYADFRAWTIMKSVYMYVHCQRPSVRIGICRLNLEKNEKQDVYCNSPVGHTDSLNLLYNIIKNKALLSIYPTKFWIFGCIYVKEHAKIFPKMHRKQGHVYLVSPERTHFWTRVETSAAHIWNCENCVCLMESSVTLFPRQLKWHTVYHQIANNIYIMHTRFYSFL